MQQDADDSATDVPLIGDDADTLDDATDSGDAGDGVDPGDGGTGGDTTSAGDVGDPCLVPEDCLSDICLYFDPGAEQGFCSAACEEAADCPEGWGCVTFTDSGGDAQRRCIAPDLCIDNDDDGYGEGPGCIARDCDDTRADINPAGDEVCNGTDDDCDLRIDDNPIDERRSCETGFIGRCGAGQTACRDGLLACEPTAAVGADVCDGIDNDCDGFSDEDNVCEGEPCCYLDRCEGVCDTARRGADGTCLMPSAWSTDEVCDGLDNDCDGSVDEGVLSTWFADADGDGFGDPAAMTQACTAPAAFVANDDDCDDGARAVNPDGVEVCDEIDNDCDGDADSGVCGGRDCCWNDICEGVCATATTGADGLCEAPDAFGAEVCDGQDNDCDGSVDEDVLTLFYPDADADGFGALGTAVVFACTVPAGYTATPGDCNDAARTTYPGAVEVCDGADNNCSGAADETFTLGGSCDEGQGECLATGTVVCSADGLATRCSASSGTPRAEACDGLDNDCDGTSDEGNPGASLACNTGLLGVCAAGTTTCQDGATDCVQTTTALPESCDGFDNNCDGRTDEGNPGAGGACDTGLNGICAQGVSVCTGGSVVCLQTGFPALESCDGRDNDCDNAVDEGNPGGGVSCGTGLPGACAIGVTVCQSGAVTCSAVTTPVAETCDGIDNDCDGVADEGNPGAGAACSTGLQGVCSAGTLACSGGTLSCQPSAFATPEVCDNLDNDCDGLVDENNPGGGGTCSTGLQGVCSTGTLTCSAGTLTCNQTAFASTEICDGLDNNCNGTRDEGNPGGGVSCSTGLPAPCGTGQTVCSGGSVVCQQTGFGSAETCDGIDNDCDSVVDEGTTCGTCVQRNNGNRSYLFCGRRFDTWTAARDACATRGYRLATINDAAENTWIRDNARTAIPGSCNNNCVWAFDNVCDDGGSSATWNECDYGTDCFDCGSRGAPGSVWIGFNDRTTEGVFQWVSGITSTYTNWAGGEPNNSGGEDCAELRTSDLTWNDSECGNDRAWVCESL